MTQQLTHLRHLHTHFSQQHTLLFPPAVPREADAAPKPCALMQPVLLLCTSSTHTEPPQRPQRWSPLPCFCLSAHLPIFRSLLLLLSSHLCFASWERFFFFVSFRNFLHAPLWSISTSLACFRAGVGSLWESTPAGAHYRRAWSWLPGSRLICHIPVPLPPPKPADWGCCWAICVCACGVERIVWNGLLQGASQSVFLWPVLVTVLFPDSNSCRQRGTMASHVTVCWERFMWHLSCCLYCLQ